MTRRSRPSPALRVAVRAGAAGAVGGRGRRAAAAQAPADPGAGDDRRLRRRARWRSPSCSRARASATSPSSRCRCGPSSWSTSFPTTIPSACARRLRSRYPIVADRVIGLGRAAQRPPAAGARPAAAASARSTASSPGPTGSGSSSPTSPWSGSSLRHPERFPRAARQMAAVFDIGCVGLLRGADGAALVGLRAGPDRRGGAADHGRGRRGHLGLGLAEDVRRARRQPLGGDALAALRHLGDRRRSRSPKRARSRARSAGPTR